PEAVFEIFQERIRGMEYDISHYKDKWYILTNWEAVNFRLMETELDQTRRDQWKELISHRPETLIEGMEIFRDHLVIEERTKGLNHLRVIHQQTGKEHYLTYQDEAYSCWSSTNPEFDTDILRFGY